MLLLFFSFTILHRNLFLLEVVIFEHLRLQKVSVVVTREQKELGSSLIPFSIAQMHRHDLGELGVRVGLCDLNLMERIERSPLCLVDFFVGLSNMDYWNNAEGNGLPLVTNTRLSLSRSKDPPPPSAMLVMDTLDFGGKEIIPVRSDAQSYSVLLQKRVTECHAKRMFLCRNCKS